MKSKSCPVPMSDYQLCGRPLYAATSGVDPFPVCLMHSHDPNKSNDTFETELTAILADTSTGHRPLDSIDFTGFVFPKCDFTGRSFSKAVDFTSSTFLDEADFSEATFTKEVSFGGATFTEAAKFQETIFTEEANFPHSMFTKGAHFIGTTFSKAANFLGTTFYHEANFRETTFTEEALFPHSTFTKETYFIGTTFSKKADFSRTTFKRGANFHRATFTKRAQFQKAIFTEEAGFFGQIFTEEADFSGVTFSTEAIFNGARFTKEADFSGTTFSMQANFSDATFANDTNFGSVTFTKGAYFHGATFAKKVKFQHALFTEKANFGMATFTEKADFGEVTFTRLADFGDATFGDAASFDNVIVGSPKPSETEVTIHDRSGTKLLKLEDVIIESPNHSDTRMAILDCSGAQFLKPELVHFLRVNAHAISGLRARFVNCSTEGIRFDAVRWYHRNGRMMLQDEMDLVSQIPSTPSYEEVAIAYRRLITNFDKARAYDLVEECTIGEFEMKRQDPEKFLLANWLKPVYESFPFLRRWIGEQLSVLGMYRLVSFYGTSYQRALGVLLLLLLVFGLSFSTVVDICFAHTQEQIVACEHSTVFDRLSSGLFHAFEVATLQRTPLYEPISLGGQLAGILEQVLVAGQVALFLFALRRRFRR